MAKEPMRFSARHWWNAATLAAFIIGLGLWLADILDGRIVTLTLAAWAILSWIFWPTIMYEHMAFLDRWVFHDYAKAQRRYRKAVDSKKATPQAYGALASLAYAEGDLKEAAMLLEEACRRLPEDAHLHFLLSRVLSRQGRHEEAVSEAVRSAELPSGVWLGQLALGDALSAKGDMKPAAAAYQKVLKRKPDFVDARIGLGKCYFAGGYLEEAKHEIEEALKVAPSNSDSLYWAGQIAHAEMRHCDAWRFLQSAVGCHPIKDKTSLVPYKDMVKSLCEAKARLSRFGADGDGYCDRM